MSAQKLTSDIIEAAIEGFEIQKRRIDGQIAELRQSLKGGAVSTTASAEPGKKRGISAAGRKAIAEAQRRRWALARQASGGDSKPAPKAKRRLSAAGRKRIVEATKKRWALVRAQKAAAEGSAKSGKRSAAAGAAGEA